MQSSLRHQVCQERFLAVIALGVRGVGKGASRSCSTNPAIKTQFCRLPSVLLLFFKFLLVSSVAR